MAKTKTTDRLEKGDCEAALLRAKKLLKKIEDREELGKEDALEVKIVSDIIKALNLLSKSIAEPAKVRASARKDAEVLKRFLARKRKVK